ncbi:MAG: GTPase Era, partial [Bacteroidia bacterium]
ASDSWFCAICPGYQMHERMMKFVGQSLSDSDVLILLIDIHGKDFNEEIRERFAQSKAYKIVGINKIDVSSQGELEEAMERLKTDFPVDVYWPLSAQEGFGVEGLEQLVAKALPDHPPYYPTDQMTDRSERFFVNEIVRNNILRLYDEEIPYASEVLTLSFKENSKIIRISAEIIVERESQKPIIIGKAGAGIKKLGIAARKDLEEFFQKQIFLELFVKVRDDWRNNKNMLRQFGYDHE